MAFSAASCLLTIAHFGGKSVQNVAGEAEPSGDRTIGHCARLLEVVLKRQRDGSWPKREPTSAHIRGATAQHPRAASIAVPTAKPWGIACSWPASAVTRGVPVGNPRVQRSSFSKAPLRGLQWIGDHMDINKIFSRNYALSGKSRVRCASFSAAGLCLRCGMLPDQCPSASVSNRDAEGSPAQRRVVPASGGWYQATPGAV